METFLELKGLGHFRATTPVRQRATDAEKQYVSAVLTWTLDGAAYNLAMSSGKRTSTHRMGESKRAI